MRDTTWETHANCSQLAALDRYLELQGVTRYSLLPKRDQWWSNFRSLKTDTLFSNHHPTLSPNNERRTIQPPKRRQAGLWTTQPPTEGVRPIIPTKYFEHIPSSKGGGKTRWTGRSTTCTTTHTMTCIRAQPQMCLNLSTKHQHSPRTRHTKPYQLTPEAAVDHADIKPNKGTNRVP